MKKFLVLLIAFIFIGLLGVYLFDKNREISFNTKVSHGEDLEANKVHLLLYYPDPKLNRLVAEERTSIYNKSIERTIIEELLKGPKQAALENPFPLGTKLISIKRNKDIIELNLSKELKNNHPGGTTGELYTIYSIVNTLTEIPGVRAVQIRINDRIEKTLAGHIDLSSPITRNRGILINYKGMNPREILSLQMGYESDRKWLEAYQILADNYDNPNKKYYNEYVNEMEEVYKLGFINKNYIIGEFSMKDNNKAKVAVDFFTIASDGTKRITNRVYFNTIKVEDEWMVDWSTVQ